MGVETSQKLLNRLNKNIVFKNIIETSKIRSPPMYSTNDISVFYEKNDTELRYLVVSICNSLSYIADIDDLVQELYLKFISSDIIKNYDPYYYGDESKVPIANYLYPIIRNHIFCKIKSSENKMIRSYLPDYEENSEDINNIDLIIRKNPIAFEIKNIIINNNISDGIDNLGFEIRNFEEVFKKSDKNKKYFTRRKEKGEEVSLGCTLSDILQYLYDGFSSKEIAEIYGVSCMAVTYMKQKLALYLKKHGFNKPNPTMSPK